MDIRQLSSLVVLANTGFNVTKAADILCVVQPAVSQRMSKLEDHVGTKLFVRKGNKVFGLTSSGKLVLNNARQILAIRDNILAIGYNHTEDMEGSLRIGTTHTQSRYVLPDVLRKFHKMYPDVRIEIHQGTPEQLVEMVINDRVDFSMCTQRVIDQPSLSVIPVYSWNRALITLPGHPLMTKERITLNDICNYPLITYTNGFSASDHIHAVITKAALQPNIVLSAVDTDVIKTYVREGLGIGLIAMMTYTENTDYDLEVRDISHLFPWETTKIAYRDDKYLKRFQLHFVDIMNDMIGQQGVIKAH